MRTDLDTISTEDAAIKSEGVACEDTLGHHQGAGRTDLDAGAAGDTVGIVQADVEGSRDNRVEALPEHTVAVWADDIVTDAHALSAVDALIGVSQNKTVR